VNFCLTGACNRKKSVSLFLITITAFAASGLITACNDTFTPPSTRTELAKTISGAIGLLRTSSEGNAAGFQLRGTKAVLIDSITKAQKFDSLGNKVTLTQARIDHATANLKTAMATYVNSKVVEIDPVNLIGQYTFDQVQTSDDGDVVKDYSNKGHNGTLRAGSAFWGRGVPTYGTDRNGVFGRSFQYNLGGNVEIPYNDDLKSPQLSIAFWSKQNVNNPIVGNQYAISMNRSDGFTLVFDNTATPSFTVNPAETPGVYASDNSGVSLKQGVWNHIVVSFGDGFITFYINGILTSKTPHAGTIRTQITPISLIIGQDLPTTVYSTDPLSPYYVNNGGYLRGYIDELRIYKSVLTASQVASIYTLEKP